MSLLNRIRRVKTSNFSIVDTTISRDPRVGLKARGLYYTVMILPENWDFSVRGMQEIIPDGRDSIRGAIRTLIKYGYCERTLIRDKGQIVGYDYCFIEKEPETAFPSPGNQPQSKNTSNQESSLSLIQAHADTRTREIDTQIDDLFGDLEQNGNGSWIPGTKPNDYRQSTQPSLLNTVAPREVRVNDAIPKVAHTIMHRLCFLAESEQQGLLLNSEQRGRVSSALGKLKAAGADIIGGLPKFETWWAGDWRSKQKNSSAYQPPRPEQVTEHWFLAMKNTTVVEAPKPKALEVLNSTKLAEVMKQRAKARITGGQDDEDDDF